MKVSAVFLSALCSCAVVVPAWGSEAARDLPNVIVVGEPAADPATLVTVPEREPRGLAADGGDLLRGLLGVSASRMGGHGLEPVIRGQAQGRLNVLLDGAYVYGGCPNRMDPPSSFAALAAYDRITVIKGVQTLIHGAGGSGGTVLFERDTRVPEAGFGADLDVAGSDNDTAYAASADLVAGSASWYARSILQQEDWDNYQDGNGDAVRSAFEQRSASLIMGVAPRANELIEVSVEASRVDDALYAGAGMDAPKDNADTFRLRYECGGFAGLVSGLELEAYYSDVAHRMDNYSLRERTAPMAMRVPSDSTTAGGRALARISRGTWAWVTGLDLQRNERKAIRYQGMNEDRVDVINSYLWPEVTLSKVGAVLEGERALGLRSRLKAGLRWDYLQAEADAAGREPPGMNRSAEQLYRAYYGVGAGDRHESGIGALLRFEHDVADVPATVFTGLSRTLRSADTTERYIAANNPMDPALRWIGNPALEPEKHHQADFGVTAGIPGGSLTAVVFYDWVEDYILRDTARGQDSVLEADLASVYRNVDARLAGVELELDWRLGEHFSLRANAAYVRAENEDDDQPIAQTPPLNGVFEAAYERAQWSFGSRLRWADRQNRVDDDPTRGSGLDARKTPGYSVFDVFAGWHPSDAVWLRLGIDNVTDKAYADHLNRANQDPFNPLPVQVNEPGRVAWLRLSSEF